VSAQQSNRPIQAIQHLGQRHFEPLSADWNGLSLFVREARKLGIAIETPRRWDWDKARIQDPIVILAPQNMSLDIAPFESFIRAGGRVLLADDFGAGSRLWQAFHIKEGRSPISPQHWDSKQIDLYYTAPYHYREADFLLRQATYVFLNLPQWFFHEYGNIEPMLYARVFRSDLPDRSSQGDVLLRVKHGHGRLMVFGDPSAFINQMIVLGDNRRLVRNLLLYLTKPLQSNRITLLWGFFEWQGQFSSPPSIAALYAISAWDNIALFHRLVTISPALFKAYPPLWGEQTQLPGITRQSLHTRNELIIKNHLQKLANPWWVLNLWLLCWLIAGLYWLKPIHRIGLVSTRQREGISIPYRLNEKLHNYLPNSENLLLPLLSLKNEFALFMHQHLPELDTSSASGFSTTTFKLPHQLPQSTSTSAHNNDYTSGDLGLSGAALDISIWQRLVQHFERSNLPILKHNQWKKIHHLLLILPNKQQWDVLASHQPKIKQRELEQYSAAIERCLHSMGLLELFYAPLARKMK
jgi:hypothetical protein